jgi:small subunit ribosomal protein S5
MVKATFDALKHCASPRSVATRRGKKVSEIFGRRDTTPSGPAAAPTEEPPNA